MKILMLATQMFTPPLDGGALRMWHVMRQAAKRHEVTLLGMYRPGHAPRDEDLQAIKEFAARVIAVERPAGFTFKAGRALRSLVSSLPYNLGLYAFPAFQRAISKVLCEEHFDLVHAHHPHTAQYRPAFQSLPALYDAQNIYSELWRGYAHTPGRNAIVREVATRQAALTQHAETRAFNAFDITTVCSEADRNRALALAPDARVHVVPNGVDCEYFSPSGDAEERFSLVFTGAMDVAANIDACRYFAKEIFPRVVKACPEAHLYLVGKAPAPTVRRLSARNVTVTGTVPDVRPYQARAEVVVVPLRCGSGTRLKILEAMAMGKAVVSTSAGAEGIDDGHGKHFLVADTPEAFSGAIVRLFASAEERQALGDAAQQLVMERYGWDTLEDRLDRLYVLAVAQHTAPPPA